jgi:hypothetical protein
VDFIPAVGGDRDNGLRSFAPERLPKKTSKACLHRNNKDRIVLVPVTGLSEAVAVSPQTAFRVLLTGERRDS